LVAVRGHLDGATVVGGEPVPEQGAGLLCYGPLGQALDLNEVKGWCDWWWKWLHAGLGFLFGWLFLVPTTEAGGVAVVVTGQVVLGLALRTGLML
jgi:hypothetical protein